MKQKRHQRFRAPYFRVIPLTVTMAVLLLGVKMNDLYVGSRLIDETLQTRTAYAEESDKALSKKEDKEKKSSPAMDRKANKTEGKANDKGQKKGADSVDLASLGTPSEPTEPKRDFSQIELDLLQSLTKRREKIEAMEEDLKMKEKILQATEQRIHDKLKEMQQMKGQVQGLLKQYESHEDTEIMSLVKIYENMKPKDAAQIFNELDMPVLLMVVDRMSERKVAPVLAQMDPKKAKDVTTELAELRKLRKVPQNLSSNE